MRGSLSHRVHEIHQRSRRIRVFCLTHSTTRYRCKMAAYLDPSVTTFSGDLERIGLATPHCCCLIGSETCVRPSLWVWVLLRVPCERFGYRCFEQFIVSLAARLASMQMVGLPSNVITGGDSRSSRRDRKNE